MTRRDMVMVHKHSTMRVKGQLVQKTEWKKSGGRTGAVPVMKSEATAIFAPQDGRWKITVSFDGRRFFVPKFRH